MSQLEPAPEIIEHEPSEPRRPKWMWKLTWMVVFIFWGYQFIDGIKWDSLLVGLITGMVLVGWIWDTFGLDRLASWIRGNSAQKDED